MVAENKVKQTLFNYSSCHFDTINTIAPLAVAMYYRCYILIGNNNG